MTTSSYDLVVTPSRRSIGSLLKRALRHTSTILVILIVILAFAAPWLAPHDPNAIDIGTPLSGPSGDTWFGTDALGRDILSRVLSAARIAVFTAMASVAIALVIGGLIGVVGAYFGGWIDYLLQRVTDLLFTFPEFLVAVIVIAALGPGLFNATLAIGVVYVPRFARIARGATLSIATMAYVDSSRLSGRGAFFILRRHVIPNIATPLIVLSALSMSTAQLAYASLSFLGFGARPPQADYGQMLNDSREYMTTYPHLVIFPAIALSLIVLSFNLLGDALRERLDPRMGRYID
jgi:peptide/nickel transport system permease protein